MTIQAAKNVIDYARLNLTAEVEKAVKISLEYLESGFMGYDQDEHDEKLTGINRIMNLEPSEKTNINLIRRVAELEYLTVNQSNNRVLAIKLFTLGSQDRFWK